MGESHWALQYLEKALAAIFEAKNMARIGPDWSPLQVVTTDPKCDTKLATMSFAPLIWLKILFTRWPEKSNNLKILDFLKNIFMLYPQLGGKRYFSLRVKARICYKCWRILLSGMCHATYINIVLWDFSLVFTRISSMFEMNTWVTWSVFDVLNRSDRLTGFI